MTTRRSAQLFLMAICSLAAAGCAKKASDEIDVGTVKDSIYENQYFGFKLTLPAEWSVQDQATRQRLAEKGVTLVAGQDKNFQAALKASQVQTVHLLAAFEHPIGAAVQFNPSIVCVAERIREMPGIKTGKDYHFHARKVLESSQLQVSFPPGGISSETFGGMDFDVMHVSMRVGPTVVQQKYCATVMKGYALLFIVSFTSANEESVLQNVLGSISPK